MADYLKYMYNFKLSSLKKYLGNNLMDTLLEWSPNGEMLLTRQRIIKMIDSLYGTNILKNKDVRMDLLLSMKSKDIFKIRDECLSGKEKRETDPIVLAKSIAGKAWGKNRISLYLLKLWDVNENIFDKDIEQDAEILNHIKAGERFYELLDYQYYIKQRVLGILNSGNFLERLLIHMPTGTGKTKTTMHIIVNYIEFTMRKKGLVIWVAHTTELLQQAYDTFVEVWTHLGEDEINVYKIWGKNTIKNTKNHLDGVAFCGLSKLMSITENTPELLRRLELDCRLIVFDEAHKAAATETRKVIENFMRMKGEMKNRALVGLSATPGRTTKDSYDNNLLMHMFGGKLIDINVDVLNQINMGSLKALNVIAEENIIKYFQERRILSRLNVEKLVYKTEFTDAELKLLNVDLAIMGYDDFTKSQLKILAKNKNRNLKIMMRLRELYNANIPTIVFSCSVDHAKILSAMLTLEEIPNSLVIGEMNSLDRKKAIDTFKDRQSNVNIIINYEVLTTGFDSKNIKCVFITRPTQSIVLYSQMIGRGLRGPLMGGNEECLLIDMEDNIKAFNNESAFLHFNEYWKY